MGSALPVDARLKPPAWKLFPGRYIACRTRRSRTKQHTCSKAVRRFDRFVPRTIARRRPQRIIGFLTASSELILTKGFP
jgi:hypothetical protein